MQRRDFMTLVGAAAVMLPLAARAQKSRMTRVGILATANPRSTSFYQAFEAGCRPASHFENTWKWMAFAPTA